MTLLIHGDCLAELPKLRENSYDSCVTDPPYDLTSIVKRFSATSLAADTQTSERSRAGADGYGRFAKGFMGKSWDGTGIAFRPETWAAVYRVLKPGAHLTAFGGTRTFHRMAVAIEDAGFEIRDTLAWLYGTGFPKSHDVSKGIDRAAGVEREVVVTGTPVKRMIPGADQNKTGWIKDNGRIYVPSVSLSGSQEAKQWDGWGTALKPAFEPIVLARKPLSEPTVAANVLRWGTGAINIEACRIESERATGWAGGAAGGNTWTAENCGLAKPGDARPVYGRWPANVTHDGSDEVMECFPDAPGQIARARTDGSAQGNMTYGPMKHGTNHPEPRSDSGSAARFFYCAKASKEDRSGSKHPTVKPVKLIRWLARLVTPPSGTVLDPFGGSGTTGAAALAEGFRAALIEREAEYVADIQRRLFEGDPYGMNHATAVAIGLVRPRV